MLLSIKYNLIWLGGSAHGIVIKNVPQNFIRYFRGDKGPGE